MSGKAISKAIFKTATQATTSNTNPPKTINASQLPPRARHNHPGSTVPHQISQQQTTAPLKPTHQLQQANYTKGDNHIQGLSTFQRKHRFIKPPQPTSQWQTVTSKRRTSQLRSQRHPVKPPFTKPARRSRCLQTGHGRINCKNPIKCYTRRHSGHGYAACTHSPLFKGEQHTSRAPQSSENCWQ